MQKKIIKDQLAAVNLALKDGDIIGASLALTHIEKSIDSILDDSKCESDISAVGSSPTNKQLMAMSEECKKMPGGLGMYYVNYARAVLNRWGGVKTLTLEQP